MKLLSNYPELNIKYNVLFNIVQEYKAETRIQRIIRKLLGPRVDLIQVTSKKRVSLIKTHFKRLTQKKIKEYHNFQNLYYFLVTKYLFYVIK